MGADTCAVPEGMPSDMSQLGMGPAAGASVTLSERAANHIKNFLAKRGKGLGIKLGVRTSGCSGMAYKLEFADVEDPEDVKFECHGVTVYVDPKSLTYLAGTELDFRARRPQRGLQVQQPQRQVGLRLRGIVQRLNQRRGKGGGEQG
jgi:iron-sulfur cluster assembly protein